jgi:hypothetical protein
MTTAAKTPPTNKVKRPRTPGQIKSQKTATNVRRERGNRRTRSSMATGVISPGEIFTQQAFIDRIGTTRSGLCEMRRRGLVVRKNGRSVYIRAADYDAYLAAQPAKLLDDQADGDASSDEA